jgi:cold shock CspA family protein
MQGKVRFYNQDRRFGFIRIDGWLEFFFHESRVLGADPPQPGDEVSFLLDDGRRPGELVAVDVAPIPR